MFKHKLQHCHIHSLRSWTSLSLSLGSYAEKGNYIHSKASWVRWDNSHNIIIFWETEVNSDRHYCDYTYLQGLSGNYSGQGTDMGLKSWFKSTCPSFFLHQTFLELWNWGLAPETQDELQYTRQSQTFGCSKTCKWKLELWVAATFLTPVSHRHSHPGSNSLLWLAVSEISFYYNGEPERNREILLWWPTGRERKEFKAR